MLVDLDFFRALVGEERVGHNEIQDCVFGKLELSAQQVAAAKTLLNKVLPDLQATQLSTQVSDRYVVSDTPELSKEEWLKQRKRR